MTYRCHSFFFFFFLSFFSVKKAAFVYVCHPCFSEKRKNKNKKRKRSCPVVSIDQNAFRVSYSRWRQQRLSRRTVEELKEVLSRYVKQNFLRNELLDFVSIDFSEHAWNLRVLERRLEFFNGTS